MEPCFAKRPSRVVRFNPLMVKLSISSVKYVFVYVNVVDDNKKPAYYEPKEAKSDHPVVDVAKNGEQDLSMQHAEQVAPPKVDDSNNNQKLLHVRVFSV